MELQLHLEGIFNFRDIGERVNELQRLRGSSSSPLMKERIFFRSANVDRATAKDVSFLINECNIISLIDLRGPYELEGSEDVLINRHFATVFLKPQPNSPHFLIKRVCPPGSFKEMNTHHFPKQKQTKDDLFRERAQVPYPLIHFRIDSVHHLFQGLARRAISLYTLLAVTLHLRKQAEDYLLSSAIHPRLLKVVYIQILEETQTVVRSSLELLIHAENYPLLMYCSDGKDRTGLIISLCLHVLGVEDEIIFTEFQFSEAHLGSQVHGFFGRLRALRMKGHFRPLSDAIKETFAHLRARYGSIERYLDQIHFGADLRVRLRQALLHGE